jgi:uncharacterized OsmC-like protein
MATLNNVNLDKLRTTVEKAKEKLSILKKVNKVEGEWLLVGRGGPQFKAMIRTEKGEITLEADQPSFLGGSGTAPGPMIYCLYGVTSCFAATFATIAAEKGVELEKLKITAESHVDLSRSMGLSDNPVVDRVTFKVLCEAKAGKEVIQEIKKLAQERCPAVYCLTKPIPLRVELVEE